MERDTEEAVGPLHTSLPVMDLRSVIVYQIFSPLNLVSLPPAQTVSAHDKRKGG